MYRGDGGPQKAGRIPRWPYFSLVRWNTVEQKSGNLCQSKAGFPGISFSALFFLFFALPPRRRWGGDDSLYTTGIIAVARVARSNFQDVAKSGDQETEGDEVGDRNQ